MVIPIFTSHYSGSLLTFDTPEDATKYNMKSVITICKDRGIDRPFIVERTMTGFMELFQNAEKAEIFPRFGLRYQFSHKDQNPEEEWSTRHKVIIFLKSMDGYKNLVRIHNIANRTNKRVISPEILANNWSDELQLVVPFYDSYIYNNSMLPNRGCLPEFGDIKPLFFREDNKLPFDSLISDLLPDNSIDVKTIYYENREDFSTWMTYKCSLNYNVKGQTRSLEEPRFDHCHSKEFCLESLYEKAV